MGNNAQKGDFVSFLESEMRRLDSLPAFEKKVPDESGRGYLILDQLLLLEQRTEFHVRLDLSHLGLLFALDRTKDGKFDIDEILSFHDKIYSLQAADHSNHNFDARAHLQAYCSLLMFNKVSEPNGIEVFSIWLGNLLAANLGLEQFRSRPMLPFLRSDTIKTLHQVLNIQEFYGIDFQAFFDLLQQAAEEKAIISLKDEEFDDVVPLSVVKEFARDFIKGFIGLMQDLGFQPGMHVL